MHQWTELVPEISYLIDAVTLAITALAFYIMLRIFQ